MAPQTSKSAGDRVSGLSWKKKLLFSLIPVLIFLAGMEGIVRLTVGFKQLRYRCHYPLLDNQYCPNMVATKDVNGEKIHINSFGLLDKEYEKLPPQGTFRVAVLGDSFTAGEEVKDGYEFHSIWEDELTRRINKPVEFLNFGVNAIGPWRELQTYHLRARQFKPNLTLLAFYWENDFDNAFMKLKSGEPNPLNDDYPVESFRQRAQVLRKNFNQWLWNNVALYQFTHTRYRTLELKLRPFFDPEWRQVPLPPEIHEVYENPLVQENFTNNLVKQYPALPGIPPRSTPATDQFTSLDDHWFFNSESWELVKKLLLKLKQEVEVDGGKLIVMHFLGRDQYLERHDLPRNEFNQFLQEHGIGAIDPNPHFLKMSEKELKAHYVPGDIHFNEDGQRILADHAMDYLENYIRKLMSTKANGSN